MDETLVTSIAVAILDYLRSHPRSADTLEGIQQCWLGSEDDNPAIVLLALERLEADGLVERLPIGNRLLWRKHRSV
ncbi:MAG TPA: hypothetical protein VF801_07115 [Rhodocyclaceae bacterium]